jgi:thioredoxin-dependent peroxiredoxin
MAISEGSPAPAFDLHDTQGKRVRLSDFKGRHVVIYFYPKDDTPGCTKEACGFRDAWGQIQDLGATVLGVSPDQQESHRKFSDKYSLPFTLLCDPDHRTMEAYGAWGEKQNYGKTITGTIRSTTWVGPDGKVIKHWARVPNAEEHPSKVIAALKAHLGSHA